MLFEKIGAATCCALQYHVLPIRQFSFCHLITYISPEGTLFEHLYQTRFLAGRWFAIDAKAQCVRSYQCGARIPIAPLQDYVLLRHAISICSKLDPRSAVRKCPEDRLRSR